MVPLDRANVDTDAIIPKQFLKSTNRSGFGPYAFDEWRYLDHGEPGMDCSKRPLNPDFVLNQQRYQGARILLARENFGCGSSREHAPWSLEDYGFRVIIAPSFADIFFHNCFKNGLLPIALDEQVVDQLFTDLQGQSEYRLSVDLERQVVSNASGVEFPFEIDEFRKYCLLNGLDDIGLTMQKSEQIKSFEQQYYQKLPWLR